MADAIKYTGDKSRFMGQKTGVLLESRLEIVKEMSPELKKHLGLNDLPRGSAILCIYIGEKGVPFAELKNYGSATLSRLKKKKGERLLLDIPEAIQEKTQL